ncbi:hypothetical protein [Pontibacter sp. H249]|uniref:hypothetical protein n=1 Tax=Pontibacter sp. H249 TaxID=3133420 RepID=UPI0030C51248
MAFYLIFSAGEPIKEYLKSAAFILLFLPVINSITKAYSDRKYTFIVSEVDDTACVKNWAVSILQQNGMRIKSATAQQTVLEPDKKFFRWLNHWFGTELVKVNYSEHKFSATGHYRYIDVLDSKARFSRTSFR